MMKIEVAETAGFCFGVRRAVNIAEQLGHDGVRACTIGPIIHNEYVVSNLEKLGVPSVNSPEEVQEGTLAIIRSHGVPKAVTDALELRGIQYVDATCPYVERIHKIVREKEKSGYSVIVIGAREHPEVLGIVGQCQRAEIIGSPEEAETLVQSQFEPFDKPICVVAQTTTGRKIWNSCIKILKKVYTNCEIFDTICFATDKRQSEAAALARRSDVMLVIGDRTSSNTRGLAAICRSECPTVLQIESAAEINAESFPKSARIGITAGASTPDWIIKEVNGKMSEENNNFEGESFEEMLLGSLKTLNTGEKVVGVVTAITPTDVQVDLGAKYAGYIPYSEVSHDSTVNVSDLFKVGDEIEAYVVRVNDVEGIVTLSKKRLDTIKSWEDIEVAREERTTVEGTVIDENSGGIIVSVRGAHVFVPASQTGLPKEAPMSDMLKKKVRLRIKEVNRQRRRVVGSIRDVIFEERREALERVWNEIEVGKTYKGIVRSLTSYGAFVDIGGVDGMVHISQLSWSRVGHPSEVFSIGDEVEVFVIALDPEKKKISLGYRKECDNPWTKFVENYHVDDVVKVKIVKLMPFGAFAQIIPGVDGLIHISQIATTHIARPGEVLKEGQEVDVMITAIDLENKKISLSIRALLQGESEASADNDDAAGEDAVVATSGEENDVLPEQAEAEKAEDAKAVEETPAEEAPAEETPAEEATAKKPRKPAAKKTKKEEVAADGESAEEAPAPKKRATKKKADEE